MAAKKPKVTKPCLTLDCENTLSARSKFKHCQRCRRYDKKIAGETPNWVRKRSRTLCRWHGILVEAAPRNTFKEEVQPLREQIPRRTSTVTPIRRKPSDNATSMQRRA